MLTEELARSLAEEASLWLRKREPEAWLKLAIVVTGESGKHLVVPRAQAGALLEQAIALAKRRERASLAEELSRGLDLLRAAAPVEVPVAVVIEREGGEVDAGVFYLRLPLEKRPRSSSTKPAPGKSRRS